MQHTKIIQSLIDKNGYTSFVEIGYGDGENFKSIVCSEKISVDPDPQLSTVPKIFNGTSDDFFQFMDGRKKYDLYFIDGLHYADQVERDIVNAYKHLKKGGVILIHDVWPPREEVTKVPRETREWCGTVYQAWHGLVWNHPNLRTEMIKDDYGIGVVYHTPDVKIEPGFVADISFDEYKALHA